MNVLAIQATLQELGDMFLGATDSLVQMTVRLLMNPPTPIAELGQKGVAFGLFVLLVGLVARYFFGDDRSLSVNEQNRWDTEHSVEVAATAIVFALYYSQITLPHQIVALFTAPINTDALLSLTDTTLFTGGNLLTALGSGMLLGTATFAALFTVTRTMILLMLPVVLPPLIAGAVVRLPPLEGMCRGMLRHLRWIAYAGIIATPVLYLMSVLASLLSTFGAASPLVLNMFLLLLVLLMAQVIRKGPSVERTAERVLRERFPVPESPTRPDKQRDDESGDESHLPESEAEFV